MKISGKNNRPINSWHDHPKSEQAGEFVKQKMSRVGERGVGDEVKCNGNAL